MKSLITPGIPFAKVLDQSDLLQKDSLQNSDESNLVSKFTILAQKWSKIIRRKKNWPLVTVQSCLLNYFCLSLAEYEIFVRAPTESRNKTKCAC